MLPQSTDDWALGLHSCSALSSQPQGHSTQKKKLFATFPLTNHIPAPMGTAPHGSTTVALPWYYRGNEAKGRQSADCRHRGKKEPVGILGNVTSYYFAAVYGVRTNSAGVR